MKNIVFLFIGFFLLISNHVSSTNDLKNISEMKGTIDIYCTADLYALACQLTDEFCIQNPGIKFNVIKETETTKDRIFSDRNSIILSSDYNYFDPKDKDAWKTIIGRHVIVPIINADNPFIELLNEQGLSAEDMKALVNNPVESTWGSILGNGHDAPINCYILKDESIISTVLSFMNTSKSSFNAQKIGNSKKLIRTVQHDPYAIGFCNLTDIIDVNSQNIVDHIKLLPIDKNGNGLLDYMEEIYTDLNVFTRGVWIGKYPKSLFNNLYSISPVKPKNEIELAFLKWVLVDGQKYFLPAGYTDLVINERSSYVDKLAETKINLSPITEKASNSTLKIIVIMVLNLAVILIVLAGFNFLRNRSDVVSVSKSKLAAVFTKETVLVPEGILYDRTHTWAHREKEGLVQMGIDDFLQRITGPITRLKLKNTGDKVKKGDQILSLIQNGKQINIYAP
ncbi:MAG: hypothetical protein HN921_16460, partial [Bacteroidetes bacterium]|nr:hypothetical protein [Bacteroidota bacterium]